jgi:hypothetical protein
MNPTSKKKSRHGQNASQSPALHYTSLQIQSIW